MPAWPNKLTVLKQVVNAVVADMLNYITVLQSYFQFNIYSLIFYKSLKCQDQLIKTYVRKLKEKIINKNIESS